MLKYKELKEKLNSLTDEELELTVTIHHVDNDEYYPVLHLDRSDETTDQIDAGHPIISV